MRYCVFAAYRDLKTQPSEDELWGINLHCGWAEQVALVTVRLF